MTITTTTAATTEGDTTTLTATGTGWAVVLHPPIVGYRNVQLTYNGHTVGDITAMPTERTDDWARTLLTDRTAA